MPPLPTTKPETMTHPVPHAAAPLQLVITTEKPAIASGTTNRFHILARVQAAPRAQAPRTSLHLAVVLDRSGSMAGPALQEAKRCARMIVDGLGPDDRVAIFSFDDEVECVAPLTAASHKALLGAAIEAIASGGSTNLHGGWRAGAEALRTAMAHEGLHRVILLSDGNANAGLTDLEAIALEGKELAKVGVGTSTYGLGARFNEDLMLALATAGRGNAYYGRTALDLAEPFEAELALLSNLCARSVMFKVTADATVSVRMCNDYPAVDGEANAWWLPDVAFASEAWALLEVTVEPQHVAAAGDVFAPAVSVSVQAKGPEASALYLIAGLCSLPVVDPATLAVMPRDELVARRLLEIGAARALDEVRAAITAGDLVRARHLLDEASTAYAQHAWAAAILATMRRLVDDGDRVMASKEARYSMRNLNMRLAASDESDADLDPLGQPLYLRRKGSQGDGRRG